MEAIAYQALVEGVCKPICGTGPPEPCPSGQYLSHPCMLSGLAARGACPDARPPASPYIGNASVSILSHLLTLG